MVQTVYVYAPKLGNFYFTPKEFEEFRKKSQAELIEIVQREFVEEIREGVIPQNMIVYLVNHIQIKLLTTLPQESSNV